MRRNDYRYPGLPLRVQAGSHETRGAGVIDEHAVVATGPQLMGQVDGSSIGSVHDG